MNLREEFEKAMEFEEPEAAAGFFAQCVDQRMRDVGLTKLEAEKMIREQWGYFAGYYGTDIREKTERLYKAEHPIFGPLRGTPEELLMLGAITAKMGQDTARQVAGLLWKRSVGDA